MATLPPALDEWPDLTATLDRGTPVAFVDFDGTLSPLVDEPDDAALLPGMADALDRLATLVPVAVVSGRGADDVRARVGGGHLWIAGSHGFEIVDPAGGRHDHPDAGAAVSALDAAATALDAAIGSVPGVRIERKRLGLTVHDRMVPDDHVDQVRDAAEAEARRHPALRVTHGKRVTELRPDVDWDKGHAVRWMLDRMAAPGGAMRDPVAAVDRARPPIALYVGDDTTDEDAFAEIGDDGATVVVVDGGDPARPTSARWRVADPAEVLLLLQRLAAHVAPSAPSGP